jgi:hypothetical protein
MRLNEIEQAMLDGAHGEAARWAIDYQRSVGQFFDAEDFVAVRLVHISTDHAPLQAPIFVASTKMRFAFCCRIAILRRKAPKRPRRSTSLAS